MPKKSIIPQLPYSTVMNDAADFPYVVTVLGKKYLHALHGGGAWALSKKGG